MKIVQSWHLVVIQNMQKLKVEEQLRNG